MQSQGSGQNSLNVACVLMQRNEFICLKPWLIWHGDLFGFENLYVIDHGSEDQSVRDILASHEALGVKITRIPKTADYRKKGEIVSFVLSQISGTRNYDILLPLDCDEFVVFRDENGQLTCSKAALLDYFFSLSGSVAPLLVQENLLNALGTIAGFWLLPYQKIFFAHGFVGDVDHGSHRCVSTDLEPRSTRIVYVHLHNKFHQTLIAMSREKLKPFVDVDDPDALAAFRGIGWHLVANLLKTPDRYLQDMRVGLFFSKNFQLSYGNWA